MSSSSHHAEPRPTGQRGAARSYIIGFLLSLAFTAIPYYMVVHKTVAGSALLTAILGFAVLQMVIQIFFFLHLGRGPKPLYNIVFFVSTVGIILVVVIGSIWIMNHLNYNMAPTDASKYLIEKEGIYQIDGEKTGACQGVHIRHKVTIKNRTVHPFHTEARLCDTLTFINQDDQMREMTFGPHPRHDSYGGQSEVTVREGYPKTISLNQSGAYVFHDHLDPEISGEFTVTP